VTVDLVRERLEYLRGEIRAERISYGEIAELQGLVPHIDPDDTELLEWAGVPEFGEEREAHRAAFQRRSDSNADLSQGPNHNPCPAYPDQWYNKSTGDCSCGGNHRGPVTASKCIVGGCNLTVSRVSLPGNVEGVLTCNRGHKQERNDGSSP
jgi:hypothetical protein